MTVPTGHSCSKLLPEEKSQRRAKSLQKVECMRRTHHTHKCCLEIANSLWRWRPVCSLSKLHMYCESRGNILPMFYCILLVQCSGLWYWKQIKFSCFGFFKYAPSSISISLIRLASKSWRRSWKQSGPWEPRYCISTHLWGTVWLRSLVHMKQRAVKSVCPSLG